MATKKMNKETKAVIVKTMEEATTWEDLKKAYVEAVQEYSTAAAKKFIAECFEKYAPGVMNKHKNFKGEEYEKAPKDGVKDFKELINVLLGMSGVTIEVCGTWMYVSGNTKEHKEELKENGFKWASKKKVWVKPPEGSKNYRNKKSRWEMSKIREVYGSHIVEDAEEIA